MLSFGDVRWFILKEKLATTCKRTWSQEIF